MSGSVDIPRAVLEAIYGHAREGYPEEVCGFIVGGLGPRPEAGAASEASLMEARRCENRQNALHAEDPVSFPRDARTAYNLGAPDLLKLGKSLRGPRPAKIIYHSHVDIEGDGAYFSATDQEAALLDGEPSYPVEYVVVDIKADAPRGAAQFAWDEAAKRYVEIGRY